MKLFRTIGLSITGALILFLFFAAWVVVDAGHAGVVKRLGAVQPNHLPEGFHLKIPFADYVEEIDVRLRAAESDASAASNDLQVVRTNVTVQYSLTAPSVPSIYQRIGNRQIVEATLIYPAILESVKAVTAQYTAEELITKRAEVKVAMQDAIISFVNITLKDKGVLGALTFANVAITDFEFSNEFNTAIEMKVKAEQDALRAENEKTRLITQAEAAKAQKSLAAEANAYQIETEARARAFRITEESKARAAAIEREAAALAVSGNPELIELRIAETWNGELPKVAGGNAIPLLNLNLGK